MARNVSSAGRRGALDEARELVALVASLSEAGDALSVDAVAAKLNTSAERAKKLVELVLTATIGDGARLPLIEGEGEVTLLFSEGVKGRRLRLTRSETLALAAALKQLGVPEDDLLRAKIESSLSSDALDQQVIARVMAPTTEPVQTETLQLCAQAKAQSRPLSFAYRKLSNTKEESRHAVVHALRCENDTWYLDAWDLDRNGERTFRVDRMSDLGLGESRTVSVHVDERPLDMVEVTFTEPRYLDLLGLRPCLLHPQTDEQGFIHAKIVNYGGDWLVRMLAACGDTVTIADPAFAAAVCAYARDQLAQLP